MRHQLPRSVVAHSLVLGAAAVAALLSLSSCQTDKPAAPTTCCDQPKIPAGIPAFTVVRDEVTGPTDGQDVKMHVALKQKTKRDDIYPALQFLYRYAMTRNTFEPTTFLGAFYATEGEAQTGGNPIAKIWREHGDKGPKCENAIRLEFPEEVREVVRVQLEPRDARGSRGHLPPQREEEDRARRRQLQTQADHEDRRAPQGRRGDATRTSRAARTSTCSR